MDYVLIGKHLSYHIADRNLPLDQALKQTKWKKGKSEVLNFGNTEDAVWIKFSLINLTNEDLYLVLNMPYLDHFEMISTSSSAKDTVGDNSPFSARKIKSSLLVHKLHNNKSANQYLLKIHSNQSLFLPLYVAPSRSLEQINRGQDKVFGVFSGTLGIIFLSSMLVFLIIQDVVFLYYSLYIISVYFTQAFVLGFGFEHFLIHSHLWSKHGLTLFTTFLGVWALQFIYKFLEVDDIPKLFKITTRILQIAFLLQVIMVLLGYNVEAFVYINVLFLIADIFIIFVATWSVFYIDDKGRYFLFAWIIFICGSILYTLNNLGFTKYSLLVNYLMPLGVVVESLTLSIILGFRIKKLVIDNSTFSKLLQRKDALIDRQDQAIAIGVLKSVGANLQPHFIYNVLTTASQMIRNGKNLASAQIIDDTAYLMRQGLYLSNRTYISIQEELDYVQEFVKLESRKRGFEVKFVLNIELEEDLCELSIPPFLTQMIIENSIKHNNRLDSVLVLHCQIFQLNETHFKCIIQDNGGSVENTIIHPKKRLKKHSFGNRIMARRLAAMRSLGYFVSVSSERYEDQESNQSGFITEILIPIDHSPLMQHENEYL